MKAIPCRALGCFISLLAANLLFPGCCSILGAALASLMLTTLYVFLRPLMLLIISLLNLIVGGLLTPLSDTLLLLWASAWIPGLSLGYWQSVVVAFMISLCYFPYSVYKQRRLLPS